MHTALGATADSVRVGDVEYPVDEMTNVTPNILSKVDYKSITCLFLLSVVNTKLSDTEIY